jgi:hypothetical protein
MRALVARSLSKWFIFAILGVAAFTSGYFLGQRQGEIQQLKEQSGPLKPQDPHFPI